MPGPDFKKDKLFETRILNFESKKLEKKYFKILSIRKNTHNEIQGFRVQRYEFKRIKTIVVPIDDGINKEIKKQDVYELQSTNEDPIYYKYIYMYWKYNFSQGSDRLLNDNELTKYIDRQL
jgi:hypothetical protein